MTRELQETVTEKQPVTICFYHLLEDTHPSIDVFDASIGGRLKTMVSVSTRGKQARIDGAARKPTLVGFRLVIV
jgi:hypothetical protein